MGVRHSRFCRSMRSISQSNWRSAEFHSAVSPSCTRLRVGPSEPLEMVISLAQFNSAIQHSAAKPQPLKLVVRFASLHHHTWAMAFKDFPSQSQGVQLLQRSLERGRLAHAYLFTGHQLDELEDIARTLAKTLNCQQ